MPLDATIGKYAHEYLLLRRHEELNKIWQHVAEDEAAIAPTTKREVAPAVTVLLALLPAEDHASTWTELHLFLTWSTHMTLRMSRAKLRSMFMT